MKEKKERKEKKRKERKGKGRGKEKGRERERGNQRGSNQEGGGVTKRKDAVLLALPIAVISYSEFLHTVFL